MSLYVTSLNEDKNNEEIVWDFLNTQSRGLYPFDFGVFIIFNHLRCSETPSSFESFSKAIHIIKWSEWLSRRWKPSKNYNLGDMNNR